MNEDPKTKRYNELTMKIHDQLQAYRAAVNRLDPKRPLKSVTFRVSPSDPNGSRSSKFSVRHSTTR